ncbi:hypothetical protein BTV98_08310 [Psychrobacter sp. Cmf 22.2]|nr:hypothetical protein BTV98_08310 [Psychrobacter sp. Cmf 22.2]
MVLDIKTTFEHVEESDVHQETPLSFSISNSAVTKAGKTIRTYMNYSDSSGSHNISEEQFTNALLILRKYRENHTPCLVILSNLLQKKLDRLDISKDSIVSSRTKRLESISMKLVRFTTTRLSQLDDLVGIRVTLPDMKSLNKFTDDKVFCEIINSYYIDNNIKIHDYICEPKSDGYRGIHQIFNCKVEDKDFKIELQIRTKIQHEWATIVEILGSLNEVSFKTGEGEESYLQFLKLTSVLFSIEEKAPVISNYEKLTPAEVCIELNKLEKELRVIEKLKSVNSISFSEENTAAKYYLIQLDLESRETSILPYSDEQEANENYFRLEKTYQDSDRFDVVLVSVGDVNKIKEAYPNYFLDSNSFIERLNKLLIKYS